MSDAIITVENLGKCYRLQHQQRERYTALRDVITDRVKGLFANRGSATDNQQSEEDFWALKDVSFEVKQGEVVGIIGRNGAGKSTLLKILSRITEPTRGRITLCGRVASLLEVGTGFHPELTGRENIFLNGAILGMTRAEIRAKFDEIVAFAEVEKFLDTPVKRYSSGMYVRLAFAVAAHLEPEILIVDEVLAVGDVLFQKKCLGKMQDVARGNGRTVLFVSHNMGVVQTLCPRSVLLQGGSLTLDGPTNEAVAEHIAVSANAADHVVDRRLDASLTLEGLDVEPVRVRSGDSVAIRVRLRAEQSTCLHETCVIIHSDTGQRVAILDLRTQGEPRRLTKGGRAEYEISLPGLPLMEGLYEVGYYFRSDHSKDELFALRNLTVTAGRSSCQVLPYPAQNRGFVELNYKFTVRQ
jgi:lipopolysaccharide transport system ATP-binding protein